MDGKTKNVLKVYFKTLAIFLCLDSVWLAYVSPPFYKAHIGHLLAGSPDLVAALFFYLIFIAGLAYFAVLPSLRSAGLKPAFIRGAFYGFVTYATFDLTSQAVFRDWPTIVTLVDLAWGTAISGVTTALVVRFKS